MALFFFQPNRILAPAPSKIWSSLLLTTKPQGLTPTNRKYWLLRIKDMIDYSVRRDPLLSSSCCCGEDEECVSTMRTTSPLLLQVTVPWASSFNCRWSCCQTAWSAQLLHCPFTNSSAAWTDASILHPPQSSQQPWQPTPMRRWHFVRFSHLIGLQSTNKVSCSGEITVVLTSCFHCKLLRNICTIHWY